MSTTFDDFQAFGLEMLGPVRDWPLSEAERIWIELWRYGVIIDDDQNLASLGSYWNPEGSLRVKPTYYVPDDWDTEIPTVSVDQPPREAVAWDAKPVNA